ncbi:MAG: DUF899 family protein [Pseudomonadota bacterium]|nr:DUF899 family protein [Pseudomonadota bacterium]
MRIVSREAWLAEREVLLAREKAATRELDALAKARQALPWVAVEADYTFQSEIGPVSFESLFAGRSQLLIYHFMFGPDWSEPCDGCSAWASALNGTLDQIYKHDANLVVVSSAPIDDIRRVKAARGWSFTWPSAQGNRFNQDFVMSTDRDRASQQVGSETVFYERGETGGINAFVRTDEGIFHTYACFNRGIQQMNGAFGYVNLLPYGGN